MFGISLPELVVVFGIALIVLGPERLPEVARWLGKFSADLRRASEGVRREFYRALYEPAKEDLTAAQRSLTAIGDFIKDKSELHPMCPDTIAKKKLAEEAQGINSNFAALSDCVDTKAASAQVASCSNQSLEQINSEKPTNEETPAASEPLSSEPEIEERGK